MVITLTKGGCARSRNFEARQLRIWADVDVFLVPGQRQTPQEWEGKTLSDHFWIKEVPQLRIVNLEEYHPFYDKVMMVSSVPNAHSAHSPCYFKPGSEFKEFVKVVLF